MPARPKGSAAARQQAQWRQSGPGFSCGSSGISKLLIWPTIHLLRPAAEGRCVVASGGVGSTEGHRVIGSRRSSRNADGRLMPTKMDQPRPPNQARLHAQRPAAGRLPMKRFSLILLAGTIALAGLFATRSPSAAADAWPQRTVRFILPLGAGSGSDIGARLFADRLSARWGHPVVVENRPGGDGFVAINAFISAHDDHTLLFAPTSTFT